MKKIYIESYKKYKLRWHLYFIVYFKIVVLYYLKWNSFSSNVSHYQVCSSLFS